MGRLETQIKGDTVVGKLETDYRGHSDGEAGNTDYRGHSGGADMRYYADAADMSA